MSTNVVGSNMPTLPSAQLRETKSGYGQNGFGGASSDLPGENSQSGFLPRCDVVAATSDSIGGTDGAYPGGRTGKAPPRASGPKDAGIRGTQTRKVSAEAYPTTFGMHPPGK